MKRQPGRWRGRPPPASGPAGCRSWRGSGQHCHSEHQENARLKSTWERSVADDPATPPTPRALKRLDPSTLPSTRSFSLRRAAASAVASSGSEVPTATSVSPITAWRHAQTAPPLRLPSRAAVRPAGSVPANPPEEGFDARPDVLVAPDLCEVDGSPVSFRPHDEQRVREKSHGRGCARRRVRGRRPRRGQ
jgi:hypothetical protein